jgi:purine-cytosine permease-like protein
MTDTENVDLLEVRRNLTRLAAVQAGLLAAIVLAAFLLDALNAWVTAWLAILPILVAVWAMHYYRNLKRVPDGERNRLADVNKRALALLGTVGVVWLAGLVMVTFLV